MHHQPKPPRPGFTLVELAVVIGIISLLAAALIPAIYGAVGKAKEARMTIELAAIGKALERYKLDHGEYPPDFVEVAIAKENGVNVTDRANLAEQIISAHMSRNFRRRSDRDLPRTMSGQRNQELLANLNPTNALVFWLGGFTSDPTLPLAGSSAKVPIYEFDKGRFIPGSISAYTVVSLTGTDYPDPVPAASSTVVEGYSPPGDPNNTPFTYYRSIGSPGQEYDFAVHWVGLRQSNDLSVPAPPFQSSTSSAASPEYAAAGKFQIITAGRDGEFGVTDSLFVFEDNVYKLARAELSGRQNDGEQDNLCTAFDGSNLEDFLDK